MNEETCPCCGRPVRVVVSDEGTQHYEPLEAEPEPLAEAILSVTPYVSEGKDMYGLWPTSFPAAQQFAGPLYAGPVRVVIYREDRR